MSYYVLNEEWCYMHSNCSVEFVQRNNTACTYWPHVVRNKFERCVRWQCNDCDVIQLQEISFRRNCFRVKWIYPTAPKARNDVTGIHCFHRCSLEKPTEDGSWHYWSCTSNCRRSNCRRLYCMRFSGDGTCVFQGMEPMSFYFDGRVRLWSQNSCQCQFESIKLYIPHDLYLSWQQRRGWCSLQSNLSSGERILPWCIRESVTEVEWIYKNHYNYCIDYNYDDILQQSIVLHLVVNCLPHRHLHEAKNIQASSAVEDKRFICLYKWMCTFMLEFVMLLNLSYALLCIILISD